MRPVITGARPVPIRSTPVRQRIAGLVEGLVPEALQEELEGRAPEVWPICVCVCVDVCFWLSVVCVSLLSGFVFMCCDSCVTCNPSPQLYTSPICPQIISSLARDFCCPNNLSFRNAERISLISLHSSIYLGKTKPQEFEVVSILNRQKCAKFRKMCILRCFF